MRNCFRESQRFTKAGIVDETNPSPPAKLRRVTSDTEIVVQPSYDNDEEEVDFYGHSSRSRRDVEQAPLERHDSVTNKTRSAFGVVAADDSRRTESSEAVERLMRERRAQDQLRRYLDVAAAFESRGQSSEALSILESAIAEDLVEDQQLRANLLYRAGILHWKFGDYPSSLARLREAKDLMETNGGLESEVLIEIYLGLGQASVSMGARPKAKAYFIKALRVIEFDCLLEEENPHLKLLQAKVLRELGSLLLAHGKYDVARETLKEAVRIQHETVGRFHVDFASTLLTVGLLHEKIGDYENAACNYLDAMDVYHAQPSIDHCRVDMSVALARIGWLYFLNCDYAEARSVYQEAIDLAEHAVGSVHRNVAALHVKIGMVYAATEQSPRALKRYKKALEIQRKVFGDYHEDIANTLCLVGSIYEGIDRFDRAAAFVDHAIHIRRHIYGDKHIEVGKTLVRFARLLKCNGRFDDAETQAGTVLDICDANELPSSHPLVLEANCVLQR